MRLHLSGLCLALAFGCAPPPSIVQVQDAEGTPLGRLLGLGPGLAQVLTAEGAMLGLHLVTGEVQRCPLAGFLEEGCEGQALARVGDQHDLTPVEQVCSDGRGRLWQPLDLEPRYLEARSRPALLLDGSWTCREEGEGSPIKAQRYIEVAPGPLQPRSPAPLKLVVLEE